VRKLATLHDCVQGDQVGSQGTQTGPPPKNTSFHKFHCVSLKAREVRSAFADELRACQEIHSYAFHYKDSSYRLNIYPTKPRELVIKSRMLGSYVGIVLVEEYVKSWTIFHATGNYLE
jgi:hypothetical protein